MFCTWLIKFLLKYFVNCSSYEKDNGGNLNDNFVLMMFGWVITILFLDNLDNLNVFCTTQKVDGSDNHIKYYNLSKQFF